MPVVIQEQCGILHCRHGDRSGVDIVGDEPTQFPGELSEELRPAVLPCKGEFRYGSRAEVGRTSSWRKLYPSVGVFRGAFSVATNSELAANSVSISSLRW